MIYKSYFKIPMKKLPRGADLWKKCDELGIICHYTSEKGDKTVPDLELQNKIIEMEKHIREEKLWIVALVSAIASVASAITALIAVLLN